MRTAIALSLFVFAVGVTPAGNSSVVTPADKRDFLKLIEKLPTDGEFFTDRAIRKAAPHIAVLFALTPQDLGQMDIYPFAALSRGLCDIPKYRQYGLDHFSTISHPELKLFWAAILFDPPSPVSTEVVNYLRAAVASEDLSKELAEMIGPDYPTFKIQVMEYEAPSK